MHQHSYPLRIIGLLLAMLIPMIGASQQKFESDSARFTWYSPATFDSIEAPGKRLLFVQKCVPEVDSVIATGTAAFKNAKVGQIDQCYYQRALKDTIVHSTTVRTKGKKHTLQLLEQCLAQYGKPVPDNSERRTSKRKKSYLWPHRKADYGTLSFSLRTWRFSSRGELIISLHQ